MENKYRKRRNKMNVFEIICMIAGIVGLFYNPNRNVQGTASVICHNIYKIIVNYLQSKDRRLCVHFRKLYFLFQRMLRYPTLVKQAIEYLQHPPQT